ncbi:lamin tail domain-containing protein [Candidatus Woesearchaeota archaeon]|nr:hypothetical protein [uncultured archaeon]MBS3150260.1 lamin tail domain-containing protein [Candidatus Woesearchaeota archaeon]
MKLAAIFVFFFIILSFSAYAIDCDWEVEILSETIFQNPDDFEFRYFISKIEGERANIVLNRSIEDIYGSIVRSYDLYAVEVTNHHTTLSLTPNLDSGTYLIKGEIFPDCNDSSSGNNYDEKLIVILPQNMSQNFSALQITEFLPDPSGNDNDPMPNGEWVELYNSGGEPLDVLGLILNDDYGNGIEISEINVLGGNTVIQPEDYLVIYSNEDGRLTLNNEGLEKLKLYYGEIRLDQVSYSSSKEGLSWSKNDNNWILAYPTPDEENNQETPDHSSNLEIEKIYFGSDDISVFGDQVRVRVNIYKGDTAKYNVDLYIKNNEYQVSKRSEINVYDPFKNYTLIVPVQIEPNCNKKYDDGIYTVYLQGLDEIATKEIEIEGLDEDLCQVITEKVNIMQEIESSSNEPSFYSTESQQIIEDNRITGEVIYESSDVKARNLGIYFFSGVMLLIVIFLIIKKTL